MNQRGARLLVRGLGALRHKLATAVHRAVSLAVLLLTLGCCEGKPLLGRMEDSGADEVISVVHRPQSLQPAPIHGEEPVFTSHQRKPSAHDVRSASLAANTPLDGHRLANGLNAPLRA